MMDQLLTVKNVQTNVRLVLLKLLVLFVLKEELTLHPVHVLMVLMMKLVNVNHVLIHVKLVPPKMSVQFVLISENQLQVAHVQTVTSMMVLPNVTNVASNVLLVKKMPHPVHLVLIAEKTPQLVLPAQLDSSMITNKLTVKNVTPNSTTVLNVMMKNVLNVKKTELPQNVLVLMDILKLLENVFHVTINVKPVTEPLTTVQLVQEKEKAQPNVTVQMVSMITDNKTLTVILVVNNVKLVKPPTKNVSSVP